MSPCFSLDPYNHGVRSFNPVRSSQVSEIVFEVRLVWTRPPFGVKVGYTDKGQGHSSDRILFEILVSVRDFTLNRRDYFNLFKESR